jgi:butyrate kinase
MDKTYRILAINPGSTSTKIAVFDNEEPIFEEVIRHPTEEVKRYSTIYDQFGFRKDIILETIKNKSIDLSSIDAVVGRGGNMKPVEGGTYRVNAQMVEDLKIGVMGQHASNLGGAIAFDIANQLGLPAFVVDPVVVDEFEDIARISGMPEIQRKSKDHPLNQKAAARQAAAELGGEYSRFNFVVAHLGGGISVGVHKKGRIIDVNNALDGDGPFSPERAGGLPVGSLIDLCYSGKYTREEMRKKIVGNGGLVAYLGTNDGREVQRRIKAGDKHAELVYRAMAYQIAKEIGAASTVLKGDVDAIILTGGLAYDEELIGWIKESVSFIARVMVYPGEFEMLAMVQGVLRVFNGQEEAKEYK